MEFLSSQRSNYGAGITSNYRYPVSRRSLHHAQVLFETRLLQSQSPKIDHTSIGILQVQITK